MNFHAPERGSVHACSASSQNHAQAPASRLVLVALATLWFCGACHSARPPGELSTVLAPASPDSTGPLTIRYALPLIVPDGSAASCAEGGFVMIGRYRVSSHQVFTTYECGQVLQNGVPVNVSKPVTSPQYDEETKWFFPRPDGILSYAKHVNDFPDILTTHGESTLTGASGERLNVRVESTKIESPTGTWFRCPANMAMFARQGRDSYWCASIWPGNVPSSTPSGMLSFRHGESEIPCSIPTPNGPVGEVWTYAFMAQKSPCKNDDAESIELESLPSAARILLTDSRMCDTSSDNDFWIELRTTTKSTTASALRLDDIMTFPKGAIIAPGLKLVDYYREGSETAINKLSCVRITTSSAPPAG